VRIAFTLEQCWHRVPGGTAVAALELARALEGSPGVELVGVAARHREPPPEQWRPPIPVSQLALPRIALYESWHYLRRPRVESATGPVDVIHATGIVMPPRTSPVVLTVHDLAYLDYPELFTRQGRRFFLRALELALRDASLVLCSSRATLERCRVAGFEETRLRHVPLGVRATRASAEDVARVLAAYALPERFILWTGTVEPRKNLAGLIRAFSRLDDKDLQLVLVGPRGWNEDLEVHLGDLPAGTRDRIRMLGWVPRPDLDALYAAATVMCMPSLLEGFGFPVVEAMAQATPVVTSRGTSTEELAEGVGILVDPTDVAAIAEALARVTGDAALAEHMGQAGLERASRYTWEATAALVADAYRAAAEMA
jgi:glycosyltransferase involved in cell wall biosynthesis